MTSSRALLLLLFVIGPYSDISGQPSSLSFEKYGLKDGLPDEGAMGFATDTFGFLWVLHREGVSRFDGARFKNYALPNVPGALVCDIANRVWVITNQKLYRFDRFYDRFHTISLPDSTDGGQMNFLPSNDGLVWFRRKQGLFRIAPTDSLPVMVSAKVPVPAGREYGFRDSKGRFWFNGCDFLLIRLDLEKNRLDSFDFNPEGCAHYWFEDPKTGMLWVSTWTFGLVEINPETGERHIYRSPAECRNILFHITLFPELTGDRILWCNTMEGKEGIFLFDLDQKKFIKNYPYNPLFINGLPGKSPQCVWHDHQSGILWLSAHPQGIAQCNPRKQQFQDLVLPGNFSGIDVRYIASANPVSFEKSFLTFDRQWIYMLDEKTGKTLKRPYRHFGWIKDDYMFLPNFLRDKSGRLWVHVPTGLFLMDEKRWRILKKWKQPFARNRKDGTNGIALDPNGNIWICWMNEMWKFYPKSERFEKITQVELPDEIYEPRAFPDGSIWAVATSSAFRFDTRTGKVKKFDLPDPKIDSISAGIRYGVKAAASDTQTGLTWVITTKGLYCINPKNGQREFFPIVKNRVFPNCRDLKMDDHGKIWIPTYQRGIARFDPDTKQYRFFTTADGLSFNLFYTLEVINGRFLATTGNNVVQEINPNANFETNPKPPRTYITGFSIFDQPQPFDWDAVRDKAMTVEWRQNRLTFDYATPDFEDAKRLVYAYKLEGWHEEWVPNGTARSISFTNLKPGDYTLRIKAKYETGQAWSEEGIFRLYVRPEYHQTLWFKTFCVLAFVAFVFAIFRYREKQRMKLFQLRNRLSRDLHDDLGSTLSSIALNSRIAGDLESPEKMRETLARISEEAREASANVKDLVWAMHPDADSMAEMLARMRQFAQNTLDPQGIEHQFDVGEGVEHLQLDMETRRHLYLLFKEAINNAAKYAEAAHVHIRLEKGHKTLHLEIADNGKGFDPQTPRKGNGLANMEARAALLGGVLRVESGVGRGTRVSLMI